MNVSKTKVTFRPHAKNDIILRVKWLNNFEISENVFGKQNYSTNIEEQRNWFSKYGKDKSKKFFTIMVDNKPIGLVGLSNITKNSADLFVMIGEKKYKSLGIGKKATQFIIDYAFDDLNLSKLNLEVIKNNLVAINLYKTLGFIEKGLTSDGSEKRMELEKQATPFVKTCDIAAKSL